MTYSNSDIGSPLRCRNDTAGARYERTVRRCRISGPDAPLELDRELVSAIATLRRVDGLDPAQVRVLGCLIEKQQATPDAYPLTLNSLRLACNQTTSRDPVVDYDEATVREAAQRLGQRGWARLASYHGSRTTKYRHLLDEALGLSPTERALLCVLMLRGPQTLGELKQRSEKLHPFADLKEVEETLDRLTARDLGRWLERRPGQKEARYTQLLGEVDSTADEHEPAARDGIEGELDRLRQEVVTLRREVAELREQIGR
jgi:uncharacterized protein YceH (UPF0502 family)